VDWNDLHRWKTINDALNLGHAEPPETYSTSEHLFSALGIPADTAGSLPRERRGAAGLEAEEIEDLGETGRVRSPQRRGTGRGGRGRSRTSGGSRTAAARPDGDAHASTDRSERTSQGRRVRRRTRGGVPVAAEETGPENRKSAPRRRRRRGGRGQPEAPGSSGA
jgi:hypothetical protein